MMCNKSRVIALCIIFLFLGVAIAPSINQSVVTASTDDDLVEVTTQACGIQGYGNSTVKLTREQYQNLEKYLVEFRARLNQTSTRGGSSSHLQGSSRGAGQVWVVAERDEC